MIKFPKNNYTGEFPKTDNIKVYKNTIFSKKISFYEEPHYCFDMKPPFYRGDILYVRETWAFCCCIDCMNIYEDDTCMVGKTSTVYEDKNVVAEGCYIYRADQPHPERVVWRPSIHMPKEAARIWLKVTDVKVERLENMTLDDFLNEGIGIPYGAFNDPENAYMQAKSLFTDVWNFTVNKKEHALYEWNANPWVWAIKFERIEKPERMEEHR